MWSREHTAVTELSPERVWAVLADLENWHHWDTSIDGITMHGPFAVGTRLTMTPKGQEPVTVVISAIEENRRYADEAEFGGATLRFTHELEPAGTGTRVTHRLDVEGPGGEEIGPMVAEDFPEAMAALLARAAA